MKNIFYFFLPFIFLLNIFSCQQPAAQKESDSNSKSKKKHHHNKHVLKPEEMGLLPDSISESSGLVSLDGKTFWTHNDSRGDAIIFNIDNNGKLLRQINVTNEPNVDWEEITSDYEGNVFVGNFGNNECKRRGLMVFKFHDPTNLKADTLNAQDITFRLPDQFRFPPKIDQMNYDIEAMIAFHHSLYLFSKNRTEPYTGYTKMYKLPDVPGDYIATLVDSFYTGTGNIKDYSITGAAMDQSNDELILISHERLWLFMNFKNDDFFHGDVEEYSFDKKGLSMEGVCFINDGLIYLSEERSEPGSGVLFKLDISDLVYE